MSDDPPTTLGSPSPDSESNNNLNRLDPRLDDELTDAERAFKGIVWGVGVSVVLWLIIGGGIYLWIMSR